jgi:hypothetical protein
MQTASPENWRRFLFLLIIQSRERLSMIIYIGLDDTDVLGTPGTGFLARSLAGILATQYRLLGVTRHQLLEDPRVPCTKKNSSAGIMLEVSDQFDPYTLYTQIEKYIIAESAQGSDPGLCITSNIHPAIIQFGKKTKSTLVTQNEARNMATDYDVYLRGLGGDEGGIIGALSAVGLAAEGNDGRYVLVGQSRDLTGLQPVDAVLNAGITAVQTMDGTRVNEGKIQTDQLRPARRNGQPIAVVNWTGTYWMPMKLD